MGCRGGLCEERTGLPCARHSCSSLLQGTYCRAWLSPSAKLVAHLGGRRRCSMAERVLSTACEEPMLEQRKSTRKEWQRGTSVSSRQPQHHPPSPVSLVALLKGLSVTRSDSTGQGEGSVGRIGVSHEFSYSLSSYFLPSLSHSSGTGGVSERLGGSLAASWGHHNTHGNS